MKLLFDFHTASQDEYLFDYSFYTSLIKPLEKYDVQIYVIVQKSFYEKVKDYKKSKGIYFIPLDIKLYENLGFKIENIFEFLYSEKNKDVYNSAILDIYKNILGNIQPNLVITFEVSNCILKQIFPNIKHITYLGGLWKSIPPDFSIVLDPINSVSYSSLVKFKDEINNFNIDNDLNNKIEQLKQIFKNNIIKTNIVRKEILKYKQKYDKLILLPLQLQCYFFENEVNFKSQEEYFQYVMNKIPNNIGVIVTGHWVNIEQIKKQVLEKKKFSNVIFLDELSNYVQSSLYVLPYIDGMINVCSSLVLKALLADVKIFSLGKKYNIWCQDFSDIDNIEEKLRQPNKNKNNILYWYLTHYDIPTKYIKKEGFLYNYLNKIIDLPNTIDFNYFSEIISINDVIKYYNSVTYFSKINKKITYLKTFLQYIFSVKNSSDHKVLRLFGFKFRFKRKGER